MVKPKLRFEAFNEELLYYKLRDIVIEKMSNGIINKQSDKIRSRSEDEICFGFEGEY